MAVGNGRCVAAGNVQPEQAAVSVALHLQNGMRQHLYRQTVLGQGHRQRSNQEWRVIGDQLDDAVVARAALGGVSGVDIEDAQQRLIAAAPGTEGQLRGAVASQRCLIKLAPLFGGQRFAPGCQ